MAQQKEAEPVELVDLITQIKTGRVNIAILI